MWMNEYEITDIQSRVDEDEFPNLANAAHILAALVDWTNSNSDGWPYWKKPSQAANRLMDLLHERDYAIQFGYHRDGSPLTDLTDEELAKALRPIKAFLTRQRVDWNADLPWAAILPAA